MASFPANVSFHLKTAQGRIFSFSAGKYVDTVNVSSYSERANMGEGDEYTSLQLPDARAMWRELIGKGAVRV
jgi:hypothetical protein